MIRTFTIAASAALLAGASAQACPGLSAEVEAPVVQALAIEDAAQVAQAAPVAAPTEVTAAKKKKKPAAKGSARRPASGAGGGGASSGADKPSSY